MAFALRAVVGILLCLSVFLLPTGIAVLRDHSRTGSILLWNTLGMLLFGLGWLVALVMCITDGGDGNAQKTIIIQNIVSQHSGGDKGQA